MSKILLYIIVSAVVVGTGAGTYLYIEHNATNGGEIIKQEDELEDDGKPTSLKSLLGLGQSLKCVYVYEDAQTRSEGTNFIANNKVRGNSEVLAKSNNQKVQASFIIDGQTMYSWSSAMNDGIKFSFDSNKADEYAQQQGVDYGKELNYDCDSWSADNSLFIPPSNIKFMDLNAQGGVGGGTNIQPGNPGSGINVCAACEAETDPAQKAQCKLALKCS